MSHPAAGVIGRWAGLKKAAQLCALITLFAAALILVAACILLLPTPEDAVGQICETSGLFKECTRSMIIQTDEKMKAYLEVCREMYSTLDEGAKMQLDHAQRAGTLNSLLREEHTVKRMPASNPRKCMPPGARQKRDDELLEDREAYLKSPIRPLKEVYVPVHEVADALRRSEVVKFDATKLLPKRMFNASLAGIGDLHPDTRDETPTWIGEGLKANKQCMVCWEWLTYFVEKFPEWRGTWRMQLARKVAIPALMRFQCPKLCATNLADLANRSRRWHEQDVPFSMFVGKPGENDKFMKKISKQKKNNQLIRISNMNMRRLPNYFSPDIDIAKGLGFKEDEYEYVHSLAWFGVTGGAMHIDYQDNVIIQLTGDVEAIVVPANCSIEYIPGTSVIKDWFTRNRYPFYHTTIRQGEGLVLPSMAQHKVLTRHSRRVAINAFIEPRFGKMQWSSSPANFFVRQDPGIAALRVLWLRSMKELWDRHRVNMFMHTHRIDYL